MKDPIKGRGALSNPAGRFESLARGAIDDGWGSLEEEVPAPDTIVTADPARSIITYNKSPDIGFSRSINPYRGCGAGCIYCFARPTHAFLNLSPGLDFETRLFYKENAAELFEKELRHPRYVCEPITVGVNTDAYQPIERTYRVTRSLLEVAQRFRQPLYLITKGATLMERDLDILGEMGRANLLGVAVSVTSLDDELKRKLEPRTSSPTARLRLIRKLADAGVPVGVNVAPVIPALTDGELESILKSSAEAGATAAGYVMLRLPWEVKDLFQEWLAAHYPDRATHVMSLMRQLHGREPEHRAREDVTDPEGYNQDAPPEPQPRAPDPYARNEYYNSEWGARQRGTGPFAELFARRFALACRRLGLNRDVNGRDRHRLDTSQFRVPPAAGPQLGLDF
ncbi:MAG: PA0069 family radical SAM protein [Gammaproteobacteria bacterium]